MSIAVKQAGIRRIKLVEYLIVPKHLIIKLKTWLTISEEELFYMKVDKNKDILDYYDNPFVTEVKGKTGRNLFIPDIQTNKKLLLIEKLLTKSYGFNCFSIALFPNEYEGLNKCNVEGTVHLFSSVDEDNKLSKFKFYKVS
jgi:hypothetical protein